jgi:hypothetical protein
MSEKYFCRVRGEVKGPFPREQIVSLIRKKRLGRHHELSEDGVNWQRAGSVPGLFETIPVELITNEAALSRASGQVSGSEPAYSPAEQTPESDDGGSHAAGMDLTDEWFYAKGKNTHGPVSSRELRALLATGRLLGSDRIWNESLSSDWVPAEDVPQFMGSVAQTGPSPTVTRREQSSGARQSSFWDIVLCLGAEPLPSASIDRFPNLCRFISIAESVWRIVFCLLSAGAAGTYVFLLFAIANREEVSMAVGFFFTGLVGLVSTFLVLWLAFLQGMAVLELMRVQLRIENNTAK